MTAPSPLKVLVIGDPSTANGATVSKLIDSHTAASPHVTYVVGNDVESLEVHAEDANVVVFAVFAGGNPQVIKELWHKVA